MDDIIRYIDESITMETNIAELYLLFSETIPEDRLFWWKLNLEERNHASLLESEKLFYQVNAFPTELFSNNLEDIVRFNGSFILKIQQFKNKPTRENAFKIALEIENSGIELSYQLLSENKKLSKAIKLFNQLNKADKDHAKRIIDYMNKKFQTKNNSAD